MFRLLGFDVHVRPGFVVFLVLIVVVYGDDFGIWLAGSLAVFTLVHELGHAVAARRNGARAEIALEFLAGYTSFVPTRPISRPQRALISAAGPLAHIAVSVAVLLAMGVHPLDRDSVSETAATAAIWWAGPMIGAINLIPVLPLDGGHLAQTGLEALIGRRALRVMAIASLVATIAFAVWTVLGTERRGFLLFAGFLLISQIQLLTSMSEERRRASGGAGPTDAARRQLVAAADAERSAWRTGRPGMLVPGQELSPWYRAHRARLAGRPDEARQLLVDDLTTRRPPRWWPPDAASPEQLAPLVALLPTPLPVGNPTSEHVLAEILLRTGDGARSGYYAADSFGRTRSAESALMVARAAAVLGDRDTAVTWLHAASTTHDAHPAVLAQAIDHAPELVLLQGDPEVRKLRDSLTSA